MIIVRRPTWAQRAKLARQRLESRMKCPVGAISIRSGQNEASAKAERDKKLKSEYAKTDKVALANSMRRHMTSAEKTMWQALLRESGWGWKAQRIVAGYIPDFLCEKAKLIVEVDGGIHEHQRHYDIQRDLNLNAKGYQVLRFTNRQVKDSLGDVVREIRKIGRTRLTPSDQA